MQPPSPASNTLHVLGVAHTIPHPDYATCAFTAKILAFPDLIQPFGWHVVEYSNEGSASRAREHVAVLTRERLRALSRRTSREQPMDADVNNEPLQEEYQRLLVRKIQARAQPGDIVCHVFGPNMQVYEALPQCNHIESCVGYTASPGLPFRIYESSAWMHWHHGKAGREDGSNYHWVIPSGFDADAWPYCGEPDDYAIFLGRVTPRKGIDTLVEIARRMPELPIHVYGPGDRSPWEKDRPRNLHFKGPVFGAKRARVVRRARCMLMPTVYIEPFGNSGIEAQLCGVPLIGTSFGAFQETIMEGVTGYRCHTLADWVTAIRLSGTLDRAKISELTRRKYCREEIGRQYNWAFQQLSDLSGRGWYCDVSRKFGEVAMPGAAAHQSRIWIYMPYFGHFPSYFQLYLDSLGRNLDRLTVLLLTDIDLSQFRLPENLIVVPMTFDQVRQRAARLMKDSFGIVASPHDLIKNPYKLIDFKITYPDMFGEIGEKYGIKETDFVGWGDCDLIYGRISNFLKGDEVYGIIGGFHGHLAAVRNTEAFRKLYLAVEGLPQLLLDEQAHITDEIAFRKPILEFLDKNKLHMFYINRYFCDVVPECFYELFRKDYRRRRKNFFDAYNPDQEIDRIRCEPDGRLIVFYEDGSSRETIYCHLQKRTMALDFDPVKAGYDIGENAFTVIA